MYNRLNKLISLNDDELIILHITESILIEKALNFKISLLMTFLTN